MREQGTHPVVQSCKSSLFKSTMRCTLLRCSPGTHSVWKLSQHVSSPRRKARLSEQSLPQLQPCCKKSSSGEHSPVPGSRQLVGGGDNAATSSRERASIRAMIASLHDTCLCRARAIKTYILVGRGTSGYHWPVPFDKARVASRRTLSRAFKAPLRPRTSLTSIFATQVAISLVVQRQRLESDFRAPAAIPAGQSQLASARDFTCTSNWDCETILHRWGLSQVLERVSKGEMYVDSTPGLDFHRHLENRSPQLTRKLIK